MQNQKVTNFSRPMKTLNNSMLTPQKKTSFRSLEKIKSKSQAKFNAIHQQDTIKQLANHPKDFKSVKENLSVSGDLFVRKPLNVRLFPKQKIKSVSNYSKNFRKRLNYFLVFQTHTILRVVQRQLLTCKLEISRT